jgi:hypothetical protein
MLDNRQNVKKADLYTPSELDDECEVANTNLN